MKITHEHLVALSDAVKQNMEIGSTKRISLKRAKTLHNLFYILKKEKDSHD